MNPNDRMARIERILEHLTISQRQPANLHVQTPCVLKLTDEELSERGATDEQRRLLAQVSAMDATVPCSVG